MKVSNNLIHTYKNGNYFVSIFDDGSKVRYTDEDEFVAFKEKVNAFSAKFSAETFANFDNGSNFSVSPVSVYMALGMAAVCANGQTQAEILSA